MNHKPRFEDRLLSDLKVAVTHRQAERTATKRVGSRGLKTSLFLGTGLAGAAAFALAIPLFSPQTPATPGTGPAPDSQAIGGDTPSAQPNDIQPNEVQTAAWSVEAGNKGTVSILVRRAEDAEGLETELEKHVPNASVNMPTDGEMCEANWYESAGPPHLPSVAAMADDERTDEREDRYLWLDFRASDISDDETLVIYYHDRLEYESDKLEGPGGFIDTAKGGDVDHCPTVPADQ